MFGSSLSATCFKLGFLSPGKDPSRAKGRENSSPAGFMGVAEFSSLLANLKEGFPPWIVMSWYRASQPVLCTKSLGSCHNADADSGSLGCGPRACISTKLPADAAAGLEEQKGPVHDSGIEALN